MSNHILAIDIETTGFDADITSVTDIGIIHFNGEERISQLDLKMIPDSKKCIELGAMRVTKNTPNTYKTTRLAREDGIVVLINYICEVMKIAGNKKITILGHNVTFDIIRLRNFMTEYGYINWDQIFDYSVKDTSTIGNFLRDTGAIELDKMSLGNLCIALGLDINKDLTHGALYDADISARAYFAMLKLMRTNYGKSQ